MNEPLKISIKVNKLDKTAFIKGKNGDTYASLVIWPNRDPEVDEYGNTCTLRQDLGAERKDERPGIIGNGRPLRKRQDAPKPQQTMKQQWDEADEVPF